MGRVNPQNTERSQIEPCNEGGLRISFDQQDARSTGRKIRATWPGRVFQVERWHKRSWPAKNFRCLSRKCAANALAVTPGLLYEIRHAANQKKLVLAGDHAPARQLGAN